MFTGIIEEVGRVERIYPGQKSSRIRIRADGVLDGTKLGDSIATSGVCLTVARLEQNCFEADVMAETMRRSKLGDLKTGSLVNLERALQLTTRLGGHMVSGHIDGIGILQAIKKEDNAVWLTISTEASILRYIVEKGSIAIDGISLTVAYVDNAVFKVSIIPHTASQTTLLNQQCGDKVNLECDIIGKYVEKLLYPSANESSQKSSVTEGFLNENGFF